MLRRGAAPRDAWTQYYRGVVRAADSGQGAEPGRRPVSDELRAADAPPAASVALDQRARDLVDAMEAALGQPLRGARAYAEALLPALLGPRGLEVLVDDGRELEYRWRECPVPDLITCGDPACGAGMRFHEAVARAAAPGLREFRALETGSWGAGFCRVLIRW